MGAEGPAGMSFMDEGRNMAADRHNENVSGDKEKFKSTDV